MNIKDLLEHYQIEMAPEDHPHVRIGWEQVNCPFCEEGSWRLGIPNNQAKLARCWACGWHSLPDALVRLTGESFYKIKKLLGSLETYDLPEFVHSGKLELPEGLGELKKAHRLYLKSRGFDPDELVQRWKIQGIGSAPDLSWRIFIPIIHRGNIVSWTTRSLNDEGVRYRNAEKHQEAISIKKVLYNEDFVHHSVIVHEGPVDCWATGPGSVSIGGLAYSQEQVYRISKYPKRIICLDAEKIAQEVAIKLCKDLSVLSGKTINVVLDSKDTGCASKREINTLRKLLK